MGRWPYDVALALVIYTHLLLGTSHTHHLALYKPIMPLFHVNHNYRKTLIKSNESEFSLMIGVFYILAIWRCVQN